MEMMQMTEQASKPWWKQLWPWLLISGPALAMIGCIITIWLAINMYADKNISNNIIKQKKETEIKKEKDIEVEEIEEKVKK